MNGDDREERLPPQNLDVERCVLGGALLDTTAARLAVEALGRDAFYATKHGDIFQAIANVSKAGDVPDEMTVAEELRERKLLVQSGGTEYLHELALFANNTSSPLNMERFIRVLQKYSSARAMQAAGAGFLRNLNEGMDPDEARGHLQQWLRETEKPGKDEVTIGEVLSQAPRDIPFFDCGLDAIRNGPDGVYQGLTIFSGPPGSGKTAMALQIVARAVTCGHTVHAFSSDQSRDALCRKLWAQHARKDWKTIIQGEKLEEVKKWPITFDTKRLRLDRILSKMESKFSRGVKWFLIDHLQQIDLPGKEKEWEKSEKACKEILALTRELEGATVLMIGRHTKGDKGEGASMRRVAGGSGITHDADQVWYFEIKTSQYERTIAVLKNRNGPLGTMRIAFDGTVGLYSDMEGESSYGSIGDGSGAHPF